MTKSEAKIFKLVTTYYWINNDIESLLNWYKGEIFPKARKLIISLLRDRYNYTYKRIWDIFKVTHPAVLYNYKQGLKIRQTENGSELYNKMISKL